MEGGGGRGGWREEGGGEAGEGGLRRMTMCFSAYLQQNDGR